MVLSHIVFTRFSYRDTRPQSARSISRANTSTPDPLSPSRLDKRFTLFELFCLPSLLGQTNRDFTWILLIDPELKKKYRDRLRDLTKAHARTHLVEATDLDVLGSLGWLQPYVESANTTHIATTNVDDDDILASGELADYFRLDDIVGATMSPDGRFVAYARSTSVESENRRIRDIWLVATDGKSTPVRLTSPAFHSSDPRWSADQALLAFSSRRPVRQHP